MISVVAVLLLSIFTQMLLIGIPFVTGGATYCHFLVTRTLLVCHKVYLMKVRLAVE
jgi:hypothetical protein